jgi:hypothetical protein
MAVVSPRTKLATLLFLVVSIVAVGLWSCGGGSGGGGGSNPAFTGDCAPLPVPDTSAAFKTRLDKFAMKRCYAKQGWQHDAQPRTSQNVHDTFIQIYYSPSLFKWMDKGQRKGPVPDGAIAIKEEYANQTDPPSKIQFWSVMIRDSKLWWDGWYWAVVGTEVGASTSPAAAATGCADPDTQNPLAAPGGTFPTALNCAGCHASAQTDGTGMGTFSSPDFIKKNAAGAAQSASENDAAPTAARAESAHTQLSSWVAAVMHPQRQVTPDPPTGFTGRLPSSIFANVKMLPADTTIPCMVPESADFVLSQPAASGGPSQFVTSNQCFSCHDAINNAPMPTNMLYPEPGTTTALNLSPDGEWRYSMMGLSGRDPIFFAQLETEGTVHNNIKGKTNPPAFIQDTCLSCHGVMGQRQYHLDKGNDPNTLFTRDILNDPASPYGALARDGVSCTVCHHIADEDPEDPTFFTGKFQVGPANELYGPYPSGDGFVKVGDNVIPRPMSASVGMLPIFGAQTQQAKLCASCHTIVLPVYDANGNQVMEGGVPKTDFEQTTYFEWLNSSFAANQPCQTCHMPDNFKGVKLSFKIANIEDSSFPRIPIEGPITTWPSDELILETRTDYRRHQLAGVNLFAMEMFDQFRADLGLYSQDLLLPPPASGTTITDGHTNAINAAVLQAQTATAQVTTNTPTRSGGNLLTDVTVTNLAGHDLPSGVSFRRAFLDFQVLDANGVVLWESGGTDADGVIVDTSGAQLVTEFFSPTQQTIQPHFWTNNPITSDQQVQIYEEMIEDPQGQLTTSFLSLNDKIKDNRIQPSCRSSSGPHADILASVGTGADPSYTNGCGCSVVRYQIPLTPALANAAKVQATLYYQSIPPYYLRQRSEDASGPDTARLVKFTNELDVSKYTEISNWKLRIAASGAVNIQ